MVPTSGVGGVWKELCVSVGVRLLRAGVRVTGFHMPIAEKGIGIFVGQQPVHGCSPWPAEARYAEPERWLIGGR